MLVREQGEWDPAVKVCLAPPYRPLSFSLREYF